MGVRNELLRFICQKQRRNKAILREKSQCSDLFAQKGSRLIFFNCLYQLLGKRCIHSELSLAATMKASTALVIAEYVYILQQNV